MIEAYWHILKKINLKNKLVKTKIKLTNEIKVLENKNSLLSENLNFDFVDILIRNKLKLGNKEEIIIKIND